MGEKYIIEIEKTPYRNSRGKLLWDATNFNTLHFDEQGISKLKPMADELAKAYMAGVNVAKALESGQDTEKKMELLQEALGSAYSIGATKRQEHYGYFTYGGLLSNCSPQQIIDMYLKAVEKEKVNAGDLIILKSNSEAILCVTCVKEDGVHADGVYLTDVDHYCAKGDMLHDIDTSGWVKIEFNNP